jgi:hypothetical protein
MGLELGLNAGMRPQVPFAAPQEEKSNKIKTSYVTSPPAKTKQKQRQ